MGFNFSLGLSGISFGTSNNNSSSQPSTVVNNNYYGSNGPQGGPQGPGGFHHHHHHHHHGCDGMGQGFGSQNCMSNPLQQLLGPLSTGIQLGEDLGGMGGGCDPCGGGSPLSILAAVGGGGGCFAMAGNYC
jgi:hypothetical protein